MTSKLSGSVIWFDPGKGYGFLTYEENGVKKSDLFVHFSDIQSEGFKTLYKGQKVVYLVGENKHGSPKAIEVEVVK